MIQYISNNTEQAPFILSPLSCTGAFELNGAWNIEMELLKDDPACEFLQVDGYVVVDLPWAAAQRFAVYSIETDAETVRVQAVPEWVWRATHQYVIIDSRPTNLSGGDALNYILAAAGADLAAISDIKDKHTAYYINKNLMECVTGAENSFINLWGGEILYDNNKIIINQSAGIDRGMSVRAGFNLTGWNVTEDMKNYASVIHPMPYNSENSPIEVSREPLGAIPHHKFVRYESIRWEADCSESDLEDTALTICKTQEQMNRELERAVQRDMDTGMFDPVYTYDIDIIDLSQADEYRDCKELLRLDLGDLVRVENLNRHISTVQKVVKIEYDFLTKQITNIILGAVAADYFRTTESTLQRAEQTAAVVSETMDASDRTLLAGKVKGMLLAANTQLVAQYDAANSTNQTAVICENNDPNSLTYGCLAYGSAGIQLSREKHEDGSWNFSTAVTAAGIIADYIVTGLLTDKRGNFYFNLETGEFVLGRGVFRGYVETKENVVVGQNLTLGGIHEQYASYATIYLGSQDAKEDLSKPHIIMYEHAPKPDELPSIIDTRIILCPGGSISYDNYSLAIGNAVRVAYGTGEYSLYKTFEIKTDKLLMNDRTGVNYTGTLTGKTVTIVNGIIVGVD